MNLSGKKTVYMRMTNSQFVNQINMDKIYQRRLCIFNFKNINKRKYCNDAGLVKKSMSRMTSLDVHSVDIYCNVDICLQY